MTTLSDWVAETRDYLDGAKSEEANLLAVDYTAGSGTMTFVNNLGGIAAGAWLSVGTNVLLVSSVNSIGKQATVQGGMRGSTDVSAGTSTLVRVNPRFTDFQVVREINRHLSSLSSPTNGLFQVASTTLNYTGSVQGYDLTGVTGLVRVLEVRRQTYGPSQAWPVVDTGQWDVLRTAPSDFASGLSLRVQDASTGLGVQVVYAKQFTPIALSYTVNVSTTGVPTEMEDIPPLGAAIRLMSGREVPRNDPQSQGSTRRAAEVGPGAVAASYRGIAALWQQRVKEEAARLKSQYAIAW